ncbi:hypothetical protein [Streptosporangium sp. NPDC000396]|uniref:hypothetical protein n=1 Tax=Streptosporangium sp. NPDC000396 TaxID=3366185 RepID=UPI0036B4D45E
MTLSTSLALIAIVLSIFAILAVGGVYIRLRMLEQSVLNPRGAMLADDARAAPDALRPTGDNARTLVLLIDAGCGTCHRVWEFAQRPIPGVRVVSLFSSAETAEVFGEPSSGSVERITDPDLWTALYEGYTPCVYVIGTSGEIVERRFVYGDTDLSLLWTELFPTLSDSGSLHAP